MRNARVVLAMCLALGWSACAWAGIYVAPLEGLKGVYSSDGGELGPGHRTAVFDFGQRFDRIDSVRIQVKGTIAPGLWDIRSLIGAFPDTRAEIYLSLSFFVHLGQDFTIGGTAGLREDGAFDTELTLSRFYTPDWGFLNNGRADLELYLVGPGFLADTVAVQIVPGIAGITEATLIIEGQAVPEPAGALGMAIGGLMLLSRQDCRR